jgi:hypothetical protein
MESTRGAEMELSVYDNHRVTVVMASGEMNAENSAQLGVDFSTKLMA